MTPVPQFAREQFASRLDAIQADAEATKQAQRKSHRDIVRILRKDSRKVRAGMIFIRAIYAATSRPSVERRHQLTNTARRLGAISEG